MLQAKNLGKQTKSTGKYKVNSENNGLYSIAWGTKNQQLLSSKMISNKAFSAARSVYVEKNYSYMEQLITEQVG